MKKNYQQPFDAFLLAIQKEKMKELWDNKADECWENC